MGEVLSSSWLGRRVVYAADIDPYSSPRDLRAELAQGGYRLLGDVGRFDGHDLAV